MKGEREKERRQKEGGGDDKVYSGEVGMTAIILLAYVSVRISG